MWTSEEKRSEEGDRGTRVCTRIQYIYIYMYKSMCACASYGRAGGKYVEHAQTYIYIYTVHVGVCTYKRPLTISTGLFFFFVDYGRENRDRMHRSVALYSPVRFPPRFFFTRRFFCPIFLPAPSEYPRLWDNRVRQHGCRRKNVVRSERERRSVDGVAVKTVTGTEGGSCIK